MDEVAYQKEKFDYKALFDAVCAGTNRWRKVIFMKPLTLNLSGNDSSAIELALLSRWRFAGCLWYYGSASWKDSSSSKSTGGHNELRVLFRAWVLTSLTVLRFGVEGRPKRWAYGRRTCVSTVLKKRKTTLFCSEVSINSFVDRNERFVKTNGRI